MVEGYQALTEKEKQTLRLLLDGHDAKSMARQFGLSVHTINERLRDARRKLSASSSKEAARLLRQSEGAGAGAHPETLGDRAFGDAGPALPDQQSEQASAAPHLKRRTAWAIGGLAMIAFAIALLALTASPDGKARDSAAASAAAANPAVTKAATDFLTLLDASNWSATYAATTASFQSLNTVQVWQSASEQARVPLGRVVSRKLLSVDDVPAPPKGYRMVRFRTDFANKRGATETLSLDREGDSWKVAGIYIE